MFSQKKKSIRKALTFHYVLGISNSIAPPCPFVGHIFFLHYLMIDNSFSSSGICTGDIFFRHFPPPTNHLHQFETIICPPDTILSKSEQSITRFSSLFPMALQTNQKTVNTYQFSGIKNIDPYAKDRPKTPDSNKGSAQNKEQDAKQLFEPRDESKGKAPTAATSTSSPTVACGWRAFRPHCCRICISTVIR